MIEGRNDTGNCVLTKQIMYGVKRQGLSVDPFTNRSTIWSFIRQMESMSRNVSAYFAGGYLWGFLLSIVGYNWNKAEIEIIIQYWSAGIGHSPEQVAINSLDRVERIWPALK